MLFLGIDSGTQSTRTVVLDFETGAIAAHAVEKYDCLPGLPPGHLEQDPRTWTAAVDATVASCLAQLGDDRKRVRGIGVSGQQHGLVALDADDQPVRPAKLWCDTSTAEECGILAGAFGGPAGLIEAAGNAIPPGFTAPKILWLKRHEPANFAATRCILLPHDYLNFHLCGARRMEFGDASGTGLLNVRTREWHRGIVDTIDPRVAEMLPTPGSSLAPAGHLREELRRRWDLPEGIVVSAGGGDNMMGAIGTGNVREGVVTVSLGTSGTLYACAERPVIDPQGDVAAFCDSTDRWLPLVCTMNVTVLTEAVRGMFGWDFGQLEAQLAAAPPGAGGLVFLPYLNGERTPNLPAGSGVLHGIRTDNFTPAHLIRAAVEGVTTGLAFGLARFRELGVVPSEIRVTGGGSQSPGWRQIVADVFGVPVAGLATAEGAGLGAAIQAAHAALAADGNATDIRELTDRLVRLDESTRCLPDPGRHEIHLSQLDRQTRLTNTLHGDNWI